MTFVDKIAVTILLGMSNLLGIKGLPNDQSEWEIKQNFDLTKSKPELIGTNQSLLQKCRSEPTGFIQFPVVIHATQKISIDGRLFDIYGDDSLGNARSFYGAPEISCQRLLDASTLQWHVTSYNRYFARIGQFPKFSPSRSLTNLFQETANAVAAGTLWILAMICLVIFKGRVSRDLTWSFVFSNLFFSMYFVCSVPFLFCINVSMLMAHKCADFGLWVGIACLFNVLKSREIISKLQFNIYCVHLGIALTLIAFGSSGDEIQLGTVIPFGAFIAIMLYTLGMLVRETYRSGYDQTRNLQILSLGFFVTMGMSDMFTVTGIWQMPMLLSVGIVGSTSFLGLDLNRKIIMIYEEINYLRKNLEIEVEKKTLQLKNAQAEMIAHAKMASLGTLSAGIAHEINNSLNYVNGALIPLSRNIRSAPIYDGKEKALKLVSVMQEGLSVTFEIMSSLRTYSGLNQAKIKEHSLSKLVKSVLTMIKSKIPPFVTIEVDVSQDLMVEVNGAGINQVIMNLVINSIDSISDYRTKSNSEFAGKILVKATERRTGGTEIKISDNGPGIPPGVIERIFDPFFTTKDVGDGMGLGLHISRAEVVRHQGTLTVVSQLGQGAEFTIYLPQSSLLSVGEAQVA